LVFDRNGIDLPDLEQPLAPIEDRRVGAMPLGELRWVRLDLMPAAPAQYDLLQHHLDQPSVIGGLGFRQR